MAEAKTAIAALKKAGLEDKKARRKAQKLEEHCRKLPILAQKLQQKEQKVSDCWTKLQQMRRQAHMLAVRMPVIIEIQSDRDPAVMAELRRVWATRPDSDAGLRQRWKWLRAAWLMGDALQAALSPPQPPLARGDWDFARSDALMRQLPARKGAMRVVRRAAARTREELRTAIRRVQEHLARSSAGPDL